MNNMNRRNMMASCAALGLSLSLPQIKNYYTVYTNKVTKLDKPEFTEYNNQSVKHTHTVKIRIGGERDVSIPIGFGENQLELAEHFFNTANKDKFKMLIRTPFGLGAVTCGSLMEVV